MDADTIERMRRVHVQRYWHSGRVSCSKCEQPWPCDTARLLEVLTPDVLAVAELMALASEDRWPHGAGVTVSGPAPLQWEWFEDGDTIHYADTPTELLAAVKAALGEAA